MVAGCLPELQSNIKASRKPDKQGLNVPRVGETSQRRSGILGFSPGSEWPLDRDLRWGLNRDFEVTVDKNDVSPSSDGVVGTSAA